MTLKNRLIALAMALGFHMQARSSTDLQTITLNRGTEEYPHPFLVSSTL
jgi:hypothetical protein